MKKTIWILNHYAEVPAGRIGFRHDSFARELVKRGYDVFIFLSSYSHPTRTSRLDKAELFRHEVYDKVNYVSIRTPPYKTNGLRRVMNMASYVMNLMRIYKKFSRPHTVIASSVHPLTWIAGYLISKKLKCKFVAEVRDLWPQTLIDLGVISKNGIVSRFLGFIEGFAYKKADEIISVLPNAGMYIDERYAVGLGKITYIPNGVNLEAFELLKNKPTTESQRILEQHKNHFKLVYAGSHDNTDALEIILFAARIIQNRGLDNIRFIMVGGGIKKQELICLSEEIELRNLFFYERIDKGSIPYLMTRTDCNMASLYDLPIYRYGISLNKMFDYLASAKPIIIATNAANSFVEEAGCGIRVPSGSPKLFAEAVECIYNLAPEERNQMGQRGRAYVEQNHSIPVLVNRLEVLI